MVPITHRSAGRDMDRPAARTTRVCEMKIVQICRNHLFVQFVLLPFFFFSQRHLEREIDKMGDEAGGEDMSRDTAHWTSAADYVAGGQPHHAAAHGAEPAADEVPQWSFSFLQMSKCVPLPTFRPPLKPLCRVGHPKLTKKHKLCQHNVKRCGNASFCCIIARSILREATARSGSGSGSGSGSRSRSRSSSSSSSRRSIRNKMATDVQKQQNCS